MPQNEKLFHTHLKAIRPRLGRILRSLDEVVEMEKIFDDSVFDKAFGADFAKLLLALEDSKELGLLSHEDFVAIFKQLHALAKAAQAFELDKVILIQNTLKNRITFTPEIRSTIEKLENILIGTIAGLATALIVSAGIIVLINGVLPTTLFLIPTMGEMLSALALQVTGAGFILGVFIASGVIIATEAANVPVLAVVLPFVFLGFIGSIFAYVDSEQFNNLPKKSSAKVNKESQALSCSLYNYFQGHRSTEAKDLAKIDTGWSLTRFQAVGNPS